MLQHYSTVSTKLSEYKIAKNIQTRCHNLIQELTPAADCYDISMQLKELKETNGLDCIMYIIADIATAANFYSQMKTQLACAYGRNCEKTSIQAFNSLHDAAINDYSESHRETVHESDEYKWSLEGYIDGKIDDDDIIEIKHRKSTIYKNIPTYDKLQMHGYMYLHNKQHMYMLQCIQKKHILYQERIRIDFDDKLWSTLVNSVNNAVEFIISLATNTLAKECFFRLPLVEKEYIVEKHTKSVIFKESCRKRKQPT